MSLFKFVNNILKNKKIELFNRGNHFRDFTYVDDIVKSIILLLNKIPKKNKIKNKSFSPDKSFAPFRILNIGGSSSIKLTKYVSLIEKVLEKKAKKKLLNLQKGDVLKTQANNLKIKNLIKYTPNTKLIDGLKTYIKWFNNYYKKNKI